MDHVQDTSILFYFVTLSPLQKLTQVSTKVTKFHLPQIPCLLGSSN